MMRRFRSRSGRTVHPRARRCREPTRCAEGFAALAHAIQHIVWCCDGEGRHDYTNATWGEYTGHRGSPDGGDAWLAFVHPGDRQGLRQRWAVSLRTVTPFEYECRLRRHDGVYRWHLSRGVPHRDAEGRVVRWFGTCTDIDDLRRAHEALRESERRFRQIAENIREVFWLMAPGGDVLYVSPAYEEVWGRSREAVYAQRHGFVEGIHPDDRPAVLPLLSRQEEGYDAEYRVVRPDGSIRHIHDRAFPVRDEGGRLTGVVGIAEDVTARREMEAGLRMQAQLLAAVQQAIISTDPEGTVLSWNTYAEAIYGWSADEAVGRKLAELLLPPEAADRAAASMARLRAGESIVRELQVRRKDGERIWISVNAVPVRDPGGRVTRLVGTSSDITEKRRLEEQLHQAQKLEAIGRLAGGVAHDFNNVLTVVSGYTSLLLSSDELSEEGRILVREIADAGTRAATLTAQLLAFSRKQVLAPRVLDPNATVRGIESMLRRVLGEDVALVVALAPDLHSVVADPGQIGQILMNLVVNARDAMPQGGTLTLETGSVVLDGSSPLTAAGLRPGRYAVLTVADTGVGMRAEVLAHLFEPFFTTKGSAGTGLGLATAHGIVHQSGGHIAVESEEGRGSVFRVYLPAGKKAAPPAEPPRAHRLSRGTGTVLVVEDEDAVRAICAQVLAECGYAVLEARHGHEALAVSAAHPGSIDLLVTDVVMPEMGGRAVASRLAEDRPGLAVLYLSGYTDDAVIRHGVLASEVAFLEKPFTPAALAAKVREVLEDRPGALAVPA